MHCEEKKDHDERSKVIIVCILSQNKSPSSGACLSGSAAVINMSISLNVRPQNLTIRPSQERNG